MTVCTLATFLLKKCTIGIKAKTVIIVIVSIGYIVFQKKVIYCALKSKTTGPKAKRINEFI